MRMNLSICSLLSCKAGGKKMLFSRATRCKRMKTSIWLAALAFLLVGGVVKSQTSDSSSDSSKDKLFTITPTCKSGQAGSLSVNGRGEAKATADVAEISLYISVLNDTAEGAKNIAADKANKVIGSVRQINGVFPDNVTTTSVSVYPETRYNSNDGSSTTIGYLYTNYLSVTLDNVTGDLLSSVLDTAVTNGGNNLTISSISFSLSPVLSYVKTVEARMQAAADAKTTAQQYSKGLGVTLGPILSVTDESSDSTPVQESDSSDSNTLSALRASPSASGNNSGSQTPVTIGKQKVTAAISVSYTICSNAS